MILGPIDTENFPGIQGHGATGVYNPDDMSQYALPESDTMKQLRIAQNARLGAAGPNYAPAVAQAAQSGVGANAGAQANLAAVRGGGAKAMPTAPLAPSLGYLNSEANMASARANLQQTAANYAGAEQMGGRPMRTQALQYGLRAEAQRKQNEEAVAQRQALMQLMMAGGQIAMGMPPTAAASGTPATDTRPNMQLSW